MGEHEVDGADHDVAGADRMPDVCAEDLLGDGLAIDALRPRRLSIEFCRQHTVL